MLQCNKTNYFYVLDTKYQFGCNKILLAKATSIQKYSANFSAKLFSLNFISVVLLFDTHSNCPFK